MSHPEVENKTPFVFEALYLADEGFRPLIVPVVKATFTIGRDGRCVRADGQIPLNTGGEYWGKDPGTSSIKFEPEVAFTKPTTDVVLIGHAHAPRPGSKEMRVALNVGPVSKEAMVYGERIWTKTLGFFTMTRPLPFEKIPLIYEKAFGGWNRSHPDPSKHTCEPRNPVGTGFVGAAGVDKELGVPNVEDPRAPIRNVTDRPAPAGFGFVAPHWQPRAALAGTYDAAWQKTRSPLLPKDFDRRHLNAASPGLVMPKYLRGDEPISAVGVTPEGTLNFSLPGVPPPAVKVSLVDGRDAEIALNLDTVIVEPDDRRVMLLWRGNFILRTGPHDVASVEVCGGPVPR
jgi:hypothetical protein